MQKNGAIVALETALCCKYSLLVFFQHSMWFWWLGGTWAYFFWRDDDFKIFVYIRKRWFYCRDGADGKVCSLLCSSIRAFQKPIAVPHALACSPPFTKSFRDWSTILCDVLQMFVCKQRSYTVGAYWTQNTGGDNTALLTRSPHFFLE